MNQVVSMIDLLMLSSSRQSLLLLLPWLIDPYRAYLMEDQNIHLLTVRPSLISSLD